MQFETIYQFNEGEGEMRKCVVSRMEEGHDEALVLLVPQSNDKPAFGPFPATFKAEGELGVREFGPGV